MAKTALVTGASRGIGEAIARKLADCGYTVVGGYWSTVPKPYPGITFVKADISMSKGAKELAEKAIAILGHIDLLVNDAGIAQTKLFTDITDEEWEKMVNTNLSSVFYLCRSVLPGMISRKSGKIINIASMWGEVGASCEVHYSAAKAGVIGLTRALAKEVAPSGICVNAVSPGAIETDMMKEYSEEDMEEIKADIPLGRLGLPKEVANAVLYLAESEYITGEVLRINGGMVI